MQYKSYHTNTMCISEEEKCTVFDSACEIHGIESLKDIQRHLASSFQGYAAKLAAHMLENTWIFIQFCTL